VRNRDDERQEREYVELRRNWEKHGVFKYCGCTNDVTESIIINRIPIDEAQAIENAKTEPKAAPRWKHRPKTVKPAGLFD
jgi:hypothetical protein